MPPDPFSELPSGNLRAVCLCGNAIIVRPAATAQTVTCARCPRQYTVAPSASQRSSPAQVVLQFVRPTNVDAAATHSPDPLPQCAVSQQAPAVVVRHVAPQPSPVMRLPLPRTADGRLRIVMEPPPRPAPMHWEQYSTDIDCLLCGRPIAVVEHVSVRISFGSIVWDQRCQVCGGGPVRGETSVRTRYQSVSESSESERPRRGRPPRSFVLAVRNLSAG